MNSDAPSNSLGPRLVSAVAVAALGLAAAPIQPDAVLALVWLAIWAPAAGCLAQGLGLPGLVVPLVFAGWLTWTDQPETVSVVGAVLGLMAVGWAVAAALPAWRARVFASLLLLAALLVGLPGAAGAGEGPAWPPEVAARLLDLSPATLVVESAGHDWLRHGAVYGPVGTDYIDETSRLPYGALDGWVLLLVGCALSLVTRFLRGARSAAPPAR